MKPFISRALILAGSIAVFAPCASQAQEFFRDFGTSRSSGGFGPVSPSDYSYEDASPSGLRPLTPGQDLDDMQRQEEEDKYNFAIGPLRFSIAAGFGVEWNDNIFLSEHDRESDIVLRPSLDIQATWRISELNTLRFSLGVGYAKYMDHSDLDTNGVLLSPNSELELTYFVGPVKVTLRDRFSYQEDTYDIATISNVAKYERYENQAGIQFDYAMNQWTSLMGGYDHYNLWTTQEDFDEQDRAVDSVFIKPGFQITPTVKIGVNAAYSWIDFDSPARSDGTNLMAGPYVEWQITEFTNLYVEVGYQALEFDSASNFFDDEIEAADLDPDNAAAVRSILQDNSNSNSWYAKFEINNKPSEFFRHRLSGSKTAEVGFNSDYYEIYHIEYNADWKINEKIEIGPTVFYEWYETSGVFSEEATRIGAALGVRYHFTNSLTLGLDYRYIWKDSNLPDSDYYQNLAFLSIYYKF